VAFLWILVDQKRCFGYTSYTVNKQEAKMKMIKTAKLHQLMNITADQLTDIIQDSGFESDSFLNTTFRGLAAPKPLDYRFIYDVMFLNDVSELDHTIVCVSYNPETGKITAEY
jgi:hypothetical protein